MVSETTRLSVAPLSHDQSQEYAQKRPSRRTRDKEDEGRRDGTGGGGLDSTAAKLMGMSDASLMQKTPNDPYGNGTMLKHGGGSSSDSAL